MTITTRVKELHYADESVRYVNWISADGTNDGTASDTGYLQGRTISSDVWTLDTGLTEESSGLASVTVGAVTYAINTVANIKLSTSITYVGQTLAARNTVTLSDSTIENYILLIPIV